MIPPALSVRQPWSFAILEGGKDVENRPKRHSHRGPTLVHASSTMMKEEAELFRDFIVERGLRGSWCAGRDAMQLPLGAILGVVDIVDCVEASSSPWWIGPVGFVLANARPFATPIPCKGRLGFWRVPEELEATVERALAA